MTDGDSSFFLDLGLKIVGLFTSFVAGIVAATWIVAKKVTAIETSVEVVTERQNMLQIKIDKKLDRLHERIDDILINGRREARPTDDIEGITHRKGTE